MGEAGGAGWLVGAVSAGDTRVARLGQAPAGVEARGWGGDGETRGEDAWVAGLTSKDGKGGCAETGANKGGFVQGRAARTAVMAVWARQGKAEVMGAGGGLRVGTAGRLDCDV